MNQNGIETKALNAAGLMEKNSQLGIGLETIEPDRVLILAVPIEIYETHFSQQGIRLSIEKKNIKLLVYNSVNQKIEKWSQ